MVAKNSVLDKETSEGVKFLRQIGTYHQGEFSLQEETLFLTAQVSSPETRLIISFSQCIPRLSFPSNSYNSDRWSCGF